MKTLLSLFGFTMLLNFSCFAQLPKISKPKINIDVPKVDVGNGSKPSSGSGSENDSKVTIPGKDPSGLFSNVSDDSNAQYHRKTAVSNLSLLEAEYQKTVIDYEDLTKLIFENERTLGHIMKLEPNVNRSKYDEKYLSLKTRADKENAAFAEMQKLESLFDSEFSATTEFKKPDPLTFRTDSYGAHE